MLEATNETNSNGVNSGKPITSCMGERSSHHSLRLANLTAAAAAAAAKLVLVNHDKAAN